MLPLLLRRTWRLQREAGSCSRVPFTLRPPAEEALPLAPPPPPPLSAGFRERWKLRSDGRSVAFRRREVPLLASPEAPAASALSVCRPRSLPPPCLRSEGTSMGTNVSKTRGLWPFSSGGPGGSECPSGDQALARARSVCFATPFIFTRRG